MTLDLARIKATAMAAKEGKWSSENYPLTTNQVLELIERLENAEKSAKSWEGTANSLSTQDNKLIEEMTQQAIKTEESITELEQKIAEQAALIELMRKVLIDIEENSDDMGAIESSQEALAIPTDSKQILAEWLDKVSGGAVGYQELFNAIAAGTNPYADSGISISVKAFTDCIGPLFKKPEIKNYP